MNDKKGAKFDDCQDEYFTDWKRARKLTEWCDVGVGFQQMGPSSINIS
jgi:hypothetical protein